MTVDILAIAAHRDDVELTCAGTLIKMARAGYRTGIVDLTAGETGTRGSAVTRAQEAEAAARVLGVTERVNAGLPDAHLHNTDETRRVVVELIRRFAPRAVILPFPVGRHPDHRIASELGRDACYLAGLKKYDAPGRAHRPEKILYALAYREEPVKPTFVVDISAEFETGGCGTIAGTHWQSVVGGTAIRRLSIAMVSSITADSWMHGTRDRGTIDLKKRDRTRTLVALGGSGRPSRGARPTR